MEVRGRSERGGREFDEGGAAGALSEREAQPWRLELREPKSWGDRGGCEGDEGVEAREGARGGAREVWEGRGGVRGGRGGGSTVREGGAAMGAGVEGTEVVGRSWWLRGR